MANSYVEYAFFVFVLVVGICMKTLLNSISTFRLID